MLYEKNMFLGLVKFFRNEDHLDELVKGNFHCQPPEKYRLDQQEGVSDKYESCCTSYRRSRNDPPIVLEIGGIKITDAVSVTIHNPQNGHDAWLQCWTSIRLPDNEAELNSLKEDISRMKREFGEHYALISPNNLKKLVEKITENSPLTPFLCNEVSYSDDRNEWGLFCKSTLYKYQREYRFSFGECNTHELQPQMFHIPDCEGLIMKDCGVKLQDDSGHVWFDIDE